MIAVIREYRHVGRACKWYGLTVASGYCPAGTTHKCSGCGQTAISKAVAVEFGRGLRSDKGWAVKVHFRRPGNYSRWISFHRWDYTNEVPGDGLAYLLYDE